jgi:hypothetical protein
MKIDLRIAAGPCIHGGLIIESDAQAAIEIDALNCHIQSAGFRKSAGSTL